MRHSKARLEEIIKQSTTWSMVCVQLGLKPLTGSQGYMKIKADKLGIKYDHFPGRGWNRGKLSTKKKTVDKYLFKSDKFVINSHTLKNKLFNENIKSRQCESCGLIKWRGKSAPLELDHVDGDHFNNELKNLMILCPNCHAMKGKI